MWVFTIKYKMFLQTIPFPFHTTAVPINAVTVVCQAVDLAEIRNVRLVCY